MLKHGAFLLSLQSRGDKSLSGKVLEVFLMHHGVIALEAKIVIVIVVVVVEFVFGGVEGVAKGVVSGVEG